MMTEWLIIAFFEPSTFPSILAAATTGPKWKQRALGYIIQPGREA